MKPEEIKTRLRDEMADLAPDRLEDLLAACDAQPQEHAPQPVPMPAPRRPVWKPLAAAAVFVLLLGGIFGYRALDKNVCTVIVDINPSVTLTVNRLGRVKAMDTGNADAAALLADVDLAGARTQDALGTLTDALADADYLTDADNTLLVTVEGASAARAQKLGRAVYDAAQASAQQRQFSAAVLCQQAADAEQTRTDADAWQVSPGKAALAETIALQTQLDTAQALSALPVQDLLVLAETYDVTFDAAQLYGTVSRDGYRSEDDVRVIVGGDAAVDPADCTQELTQYGGQLAYRVRFAAADGEYCYTIAARTGDILDVQRPEKPAQTPDLRQPRQSRTFRTIRPTPRIRRSAYPRPCAGCCRSWASRCRRSAMSTSSACMWAAATPTTSPSRRTGSRIRFTWTPTTAIFSKSIS